MNFIPSKIRRLKTTGIVLYLFFGGAFTSYTQTAWKKTTEELIVADPPFKQCHASTVVELAPGQLMAAWFGGSHEGGKDVVIWMSIQSTGTAPTRWSKQGHVMQAWSADKGKTWASSLLLS